MDNEHAAKAALDALPVGGEAPDQFRASNGLVLQLRRVSQMIIGDANRRMSPPRPPRTWREDLSREEENPQDPGYLEAVRHYQYDTAMLAMRVYFILGTKPITIPSDIEPPESELWAEEIQAADADADIPAGGPRRYLAWLKLYAVPNEDQTRLLNSIIRFSGGTLEEDVEKVVDSFRSDEGRDRAVGLPLSPEDQSRPSDALSVRNGTGTRSEGSGGIRALPVDDVDERVDVV